MNKNIIRGAFVFIFYFGYDILLSYSIRVLGINTSSWSMLIKNIFLIGTHIPPIIVVALIYFEELKIKIKDFSKNGFKYISNYITIFMLGIICMGVLNLILAKITGLEMSNNEELVREYIKKLPIYMSFSTVIYAPIMEEITFRRSIREIFDNKWLFIITSGFIFGFAHITGVEGVIKFTDFLMSIPYMIMGSVFAYMYYDSDNIFTSISMHSIYNFILLMLQFIGG